MHTALAEHYLTTGQFQKSFRYVLPLNCNDAEKRALKRSATKRFLNQALKANDWQLPTEIETLLDLSEINPEQTFEAIQAAYRLYAKEQAEKAEAKLNQEKLISLLQEKDKEIKVLTNDVAHLKLGLSPLLFSVAPVQTPPAYEGAYDASSKTDPKQSNVGAREKIRSYLI